MARNVLSRSRRALTRNALYLCLLLPNLLQAADSSPYAPDVPEPGSVEEIAKLTTAREFLPASVAYVPSSSTTASPKRALGQMIGTPNELHRVTEIHGYFRQLARTSRRVEVRVAGTTEEGRELLSVFISNEKNIRNLDELRQVTARLADPRTTGRAEMKTLVRSGKVFYYLLGGLHASETASPEMLMELAYRLAVSERPEVRALRDQVVVVITPVADPDGRDRVVDWYYRHLRGRDLPYNKLREFSSPPYWGHYVYHDSNRDGLQRQLAATRAIHDTYYRYRPQVLHDLHESIPLMYISTGHGPYNPSIDPVSISEWTQFAYHEASELQAQGLPGVWVWGFWDGWSPGYTNSVANFHNGVTRFYETFGNSLAGTFDRDLTDARSQFVGKPVTDAQWYRPWPPASRVTWSLRNNINYSQAGVLAALKYAALHREELLRNYWIKAERAISLGKLNAPRAWYFPEQQRDRKRLASMLNLLRAQDVEVHRLEADVTVAGTRYRGGGYLVRADQPAGGLVRTVMEKQAFPADEPNPPYDDVAWTWPLLRDVETRAVDDRAMLEAKMALVETRIELPGGVEGEGDTYLLRDGGQTGLLSARVRLGEAAVQFAQLPFETDGKSFPAGSWIIRAPRGAIDDLATQLGLDFVAASQAPAVASREVDLPRLALLHTWTDTQDAGWMRRLFDSEGIPYTLLSPDDVRNGAALNTRFDVILMPNSKGRFKDIVHGLDPSVGPLAYTKTEEYPSHGTPNSSEDITRGIGFVGLDHLKAFVQAGGVLISLANAGTLPVEAGLVRDVDSTLPVGTPGSELRARVVRPDHPISFGYDQSTSVFRGNGPVFDVKADARGRVVLEFGDGSAESADGKTRTALEGVGSIGASPAPTSQLVLSGYIRNAADVQGKPAIIDYPVGQGRVILYSFNPIHRLLNESDFRFLFNAILYWNDLPN